MTVEEFIEEYRNEDVRMLALKGTKCPDVDMPYVLDQIRGWQIARTKLPSWAEKKVVIYPPHLSMEQCSSEQTALYKRGVVERLMADGGEMVDLTGGFGVDFSYLATGFRRATYVERMEHLCDIARKNFNILSLSHAEVVCADGTQFLKTMNSVDFIYLDPARRDNNGGRTYALEDCTPNVIALKSLLLEKAKMVMVKLSPMVDWHKTVSDLGCVREVHIISAKNECKELLVVLTKEGASDIRIFCNNDSSTISFSLEDNEKSRMQIAQPDDILENIYLFEPNSSVMKASCFNILSERYNVKKIASHSNLFISDEDMDFPGRRFRILSVSTMNKKELKHTLLGIGKANIAVRNFPLPAEELRKKLKVSDGGSHYIFGTTDSADKHIIIVCEKVK